MGNKNMIFKNFTLPDVTLEHKSEKSFRVVCGKPFKDVPLQIDPKFKYKTVNLRTQS